MTIGPATIRAIVIAALAVLAWWVAGRLRAPAWLCQFAFAVVLVLGLLVGPLVRLP